MRIEELTSSEQQLVMHCADIKSQLTLLLDTKGISALEARVVKQLSLHTSILCAVQVRVRAAAQLRSLISSRPDFSRHFVIFPSLRRSCCRTCRGDGSVRAHPVHPLNCLLPGIIAALLMKPSLGLFRIRSSCSERAHELFLIVIRSSHFRQIPFCCACHCLRGIQLGR
jgi:hypothetical protein